MPGELYDVALRRWIATLARSVAVYGVTGQGVPHPGDVNGLFAAVKVVDVQDYAAYVHLPGRLPGKPF